MSDSMIFPSAEASHKHSLETLNTLFRFDDFMSSVGTLVDMGCGDGLDTHWWSTRHTREDAPKPLNIECTGVDIVQRNNLAPRSENFKFLKHDFEQPWPKKLKRKFDVLWCHDAFQYAINPIETLKLWRDITSPNGMMVLIVPQTTNLVQNRQDFVQQDYVYHHWTLVNLIHVLAISGWDVASAYFKKEPNNPWIHIMAYRGEHEPMDPRTTSWYNLAENNLLPKSAQVSVEQHGYLRQQDLTLPWIDRSLHWFGRD